MLLQTKQQGALVCEVATGDERSQLSKWRRQSVCRHTDFATRLCGSMLSVALDGGQWHSRQDILVRGVIWMVCLENSGIPLFQELCWLAIRPGKSLFVCLLVCLIGHLFLLCPNKMDYSYITALFSECLVCSKIHLYYLFKCPFIFRTSSACGLMYVLFFGYGTLLLAIILANSSS